MDRISFVNVAGKKVWAGEAAMLAICDESMERLLRWRTTGGLFIEASD